MKIIFAKLGQNGLANECGEKGLQLFLPPVSFWLFLCGSIFIAFGTHVDIFSSTAEGGRSTHYICISSSCFGKYLTDKK